MSDDDLIRRGDVLDLFVDWWLYAPSGQQVTGDVCDAVAAIPTVTPATDHKALLEWLDSLPKEPTPELRKIWADYEKATGRYGNRKVSKMIQQVEDLRQIIRAEGTPAIQDAWDKVEEHIDYAYRKL